MNMKSAIIIGVIVLLSSAIVTPFFIGKNNNSNISSNKVEDIDNKGNLLFNSSDEDNEEFDNNIDVSKVDENTTLNTNNNEVKENNTTTQTSNKQTTNNNQSAETKIAEIIDVGAESSTTTNEQTSNNAEKETPVNNITIPDGAVGILKIDKIGLYQKVAEGHSLAVLKTDLGHVDGTAYHTGNIGILGHNSGNAGYFKRLTELVVGDKIQYLSNNGIRTYEVSEITQIDDTDWSKLANTTDNRITLITCVKNVPLKRLCIQASEI